MTIPTISIPGSNMAIVSIGERTYYFSYQTCVAVHNGVAVFRRDRSFSKTTCKHMTQMNIKDWSQVDDSTFEAAATLPDEAITMRDAMRALRPKATR